METMRKRIGEFLVDKGVLNTQQVDRILKHSESTGLRFGEAGMELGLLDRDSMVRVFGPSFRVDFFHLDPDYFPKVTAGLIPVDLLIGWGALPLGFKTEYRFFRARKMMNIGLLNPERREEVLEGIRSHLESTSGVPGLAGFKVYLILADQFLDVMESVYGISEERIRDRAVDRIDGTLELFLQHAHGEPSPPPAE